MKESKQVLAGEPVAQFFKRGIGSKGCWICKDRRKAQIFCQTLSASASKNGVSIQRMTNSTIIERKNRVSEVNYTIIAIIEG